MAKFRYSTDGGSTWITTDETLPFNIPVTASQTVVVEPIGAAVTNAGVVSGNVLTLTYDPANPSTDIRAETNTAGTFRWAITTSMTPPSPSAITTGSGYYAAGSVATVAGTLAITLPALSGAPDLYFHAFVDGSAADTNIASTRVYIGSASTFAQISATTGSPIVTNYADGDGSWRAYEFTGDGSFTVSAGGGLEYELVAGGGGGGGGYGYSFNGGGGAGGVLTGTASLSPATYSVKVGAAGVGRVSGGAATNGGDTTALGFTAVGGGCGSSSDGSQPVHGGAGRSGGSGGGGPGGLYPGGAGTAGQGYAGGAGGAQSAAGGGGAGGAGAAGVSNGAPGRGGIGVTSRITGTAKDIAGGGAGGGGTAAIASHGGGGSGGTTSNGSPATEVGGGGGGASANSNSPTPGGNGYRGRFVIRVKAA